MTRPFARSLSVVVALSASGSPVLAQAPLDSSPLFGDTDNERLGFCIARLGDLDGDLIDDIAIGAPEADSMGLVDNGVVTVVSGADLGVEIGRFHGVVNNDRAGSAIAALNDVDGDLVPDFAVGVPLHDGAGGADQGQVVLVSGSTFTALTSFTIDEAAIELGSALAHVGDRNGDGLDDLLAGAPHAATLASNGGAAVLLSVTATGFTQQQRFDGDGGNDQLGSALCSLPDVNGDGLDELVIASPFAAAGGLSRGRVQVLSGDSTLSYPLLLELTGGSDFDQLGAAVAAIQDPDDGTTPRLVATFLGRNGNAGGCSIHAVPSGNVVRNYDGEFGNMFLGASLAVLPDQDGDGVEDLLIGSPLDSSGGVFSAGVVELLSGAGDGTVGGDLELLFRERGTAAIDRCGEALASLGDLDGDGCDDFAWTSSGEQDPVSGLFSGAAHLVRSNTPRVRLDQANYVDFDPITIDALGYASSPTILMIGTAGSGVPPWLVSFGAPYLWVMGLSTDAAGKLSLTSNLPDTGGTSYQIFLQAFLLKPGGKMGTIHFSELAVASVN